MTHDSDFGMSGTTSAATTLSAMFDSREDADTAISRLNQAGVSSSQIRMEEGATGMGGTAATPAATSGTTAHGKEEDKGFFDKLGDYFFPDEDRYSYAEGLSRGSFLVTVTGLDSAQYDDVLDILDDEGTVDLAEREESWRSEGWGGYENSSYAAGMTGTAGMAGASGAATGLTSGVGTGTDMGREDLVPDTETRDRRADDAFDARTGGTHDRHPEDETVPVMEERLRVGKRDTSHGRVRVRAYTVEEPVSESVSLREEHVTLDRRPVDRAVTGDDVFTDRTIEAEEHREEAVVSKEARVVEEIGLRRTSETHDETVSDSVRHTEVEIEDDRDDTPRSTTPPTTTR